MGYTTTFTGALTFTHQITVQEMGTIGELLDEECRDHPEWDLPPGAPADLGYIDLEFLTDFSGLQWNGGEKTSDMAHAINSIILELRKQNPAFGLTGELLAQGEEPADRWRLVIGANGLAQKIQSAPTDQTVTCPRCQEVFRVETA